MAGKSKLVGLKTIQESDELKALASEIIDEFKMDFGPAKIAYLMIEPMIGKTVAARCIKASVEMKYYTDADYVIECSKDVWNGLKVETKKILMYNQLSKIDPKFDDKDQIWKFRIAKFDSYGFSHVTKKYGVNWVDEVRTVIESINDLDSTESRKVGI